MPQVHYKLLPPKTGEITEPMRFECLEAACKDKESLLSGDLFDHAKDIHQCSWIKTDTTALNDFPGFSDRPWPAISVYGSP